MPTLTKTNLLVTNAPGGLGSDTMELPEPAISPDQCAHALGVFMFDWDRLMAALDVLTARLFEIDSLRAHIIVESVQQSALRVLLRDIGSHYLNAKQFQELSAILADVQKLAGVRNRLVHGRWTIVVKMDEGKPISAEWVRVLSVTDKETMYTMMDPKHQKSKLLKQKYEYRPDAIHVEALKLNGLADQLIKLSGELIVSKDHPSEPRSQRRQASRTPKAKRAR